MTGFSNFAFVIDDAPCIGDYRIVDFRFSTDDRASRYNQVSPQHSAPGNDGRGVDCVDQFQLGIQNQLGVTGANAVIPDGDDGAANLLLAQFGKDIDMPKHLN